MRVAALPVVMALVGPLQGCSDTVCTKEMRGSFVLDVVDGTTRSPVCGADATAIDAGGDPVSVAPDQFLDGACGFFYGPPERSGVFTFTVTAPGYQPTTFTLKVSADECHVITAHATVRLTPV